MQRTQLGKIFPIFFGLLISASANLFGQSNFKLPDYQTQKLDNGLTVFLMPQKEVPLLHISFGIEAGSSVDTPEKSGLADFTLNALSLGTPAYTKTQIERQLDQLGASMSSAIEPDYSMLELSLASKDISTLLPIFADIIQRPSLPPSELAKLKEITLNELQQTQESPSKVADEYFASLVYGSHPYSLPLKGKTRTLKGLTRQDVANFHAKHFQPAKAYLAIAGDFDPKLLNQLLLKHFAQWKPSTSLQVALPSFETQVAESRVALVDKKDALETTFRIGGPGVPQSDPDWVGLQVVNTALGGRFTSRLNDALRVKSGLTYGARSGFSAHKVGGSFAIATFTAKENTFKAIDLALETYRTFLNEGLSEAELASAKAYVIGQYPPRFETLASLCEYMVENAVYGLTRDRVDRFTENVEKLSLQDVQQLIHRHFPKDKLDMLLIGRAEELEPKLAKYGKVISLTPGEKRANQNSKTM